MAGLSELKADIMKCVGYAKTKKGRKARARRRRR
jgi:hypothetical protein